MSNSGIIAKEYKVNIVYDIPNETEKKSYNAVSQSVLDSEKLESMGWNPQYDIFHGIRNTIKRF